MEYIRRCMLVFLTALIAACSTIQAPEASQPLPEKAILLPSAKLTLQYSETSEPQLEQHPTALAKAIALKYKCPLKVATEAITYAEKYSYRDFPRRDHILAFIAIESGFNPAASRNGSKGAMQVLVKTHRDKIQGRFDLQEQIRVGALIARQAYEELHKNTRAAVMAYNVGTGAYLHGARPRKYYEDYSKHLTWLKSQQSGSKLV